MVAYNTLEQGGYSRDNVLALPTVPPTKADQSIAHGIH